MAAFLGGFGAATIADKFLKRKSKPNEALPSSVPSAASQGEEDRPAETEEQRRVRLRSRAALVGTSQGRSFSPSTSSSDASGRRKLFGN